MIALRDPRVRLPAMGAALATAVALWALLASFDSLSWSAGAAVYLLAHFVVFIDGLDLVVRAGVRARRLPDGGRGLASPSIPLLDTGLTDAQRRLHLRPYALAVSVHDFEHEVDEFLDLFAPYQDKLWVIDDASHDSTSRRLDLAGVRCLAASRNRRKPGAIRRLLRDLPPEIETVLVLDPDVVIRGAGRADLETVIFDFQRSGAAALCPRIVIREDGLLAKLQGLEYHLACSFGRQCMGETSVNAGISLYRRDALEHALERHSLSVYAEDLENSVLLLGAGERIYFDGRLVIETEPKRRWRDLFSQRVGWAYGLLRVYARRWAEVREAARRDPMSGYQYLGYLGVLSLLLHPLRLASLAVLVLTLAVGVASLFGLEPGAVWGLFEPSYFLSAYSKYLLFTLAAVALAVPRGERLRFLPIVPLYFLYALALIVPQTLGYANWLSLKLLGRRLYRDHYQDDATLSGEWHGKDDEDKRPDKPHVLRPEDLYGPRQDAPYDGEPDREQERL